MNDLEREAAARREIEFLTEELASHVGVASRLRSGRDDGGERARLRVTQRINHTRRKVMAAHPLLADHLTRFVRTGRFCTYVPDSHNQIDWEI